MLRMLLVIVAVALVCGCEPKLSAADQIKLEQKEARALAAASQQRLITTTVQSVSAAPLIPDDSDWDYRFQAQDHFVDLEGKNVLVEVEVGDVVRRADGLVVSGEPSAFTYPLLIWVRLHGVREETAYQIDSHDSVICIGEPTVSVPAGPYLKMRALSEDEIEVETSAIPLIVDVNCTHAWHKKYESPRLR